MIKIYYRVALQILAIGVVWSVFFLANLTKTQAEVVRSIKITGNKHVDDQTIREHLSIKPGVHFSALDIDKSVKSLVALELFSDVHIQQSGDVLIVEVLERAIIDKIIFQGNKKLKDAYLERTLILKPGGTFSKINLDADEQAIRAAYAKLGQYGVGVTSRIVKRNEGHVNIIFQVLEGKRVKISKISFEGNKAFSHRQLIDIILTKQSNIFSWLSGGDVYSNDRLAADKIALRRFYQSHGYADFQVLRINTYFNSEKNEYKIIFFIDEGICYKFENIRIESTITELDTKQISHVLNTKRGDVYNVLKIEESITTLNKRVTDLGYPFAQIESLEDRDFSKKTISLIYRINEGAHIYIERIDIKGNERTLDHVIRREFDFGEGDAFNNTAIIQAKRRLEDLDFFQQVNISTSPGSQTDRIILIVNVIEKPTGEFLMGGGYATGGETPGIVGNFSIKDSSFLGNGQDLHLGIDVGQHGAHSYSFSFTEPYFLEYRLSSGFNIFKRTYRMSDDYYVQKTGGSLRFGLPIADNLTANIGYNYTKEEYSLSKENREDYSDAIIKAIEDGPWKRSSANYSLTYNSLDHLYNPYDGLYARLDQEYAGLGGDAHFLKTVGKVKIYNTLSESYGLVCLLGFGGGYIQEINSGGTHLFDLFRNNVEMIRGFEFNGIGPMQKSSNGKKFFLGGTTYLHATAELQFLMPIIPESLGIRGAMFVDTATLYGNNYQIKPQFDSEIININIALRSSLGISLMWASPLGPLRFDYAVPVMKQEGDIVQRINFGVSTKF